MPKEGLLLAEQLMSPNKGYSMSDWSLAMKNSKNVGKQNREIASAAFGETAAEHQRAKDLVKELGLPSYNKVTTTVGEFLDNPEKYLEMVRENNDNNHVFYLEFMVKATGERKFEFGLNLETGLTFVEKVLDEGQFQKTDELIVSTYKENVRGANVYFNQQGEAGIELVTGSVARLDYGETVPDLIGFWNMEDGLAVKKYGNELEEEELVEANEAIQTVIEMIPKEKDGGKPKMEGKYSIIFYRDENKELQPIFLDVSPLKSHDLIVVGAIKRMASETGKGKTNQQSLTTMRLTGQVGWKYFEPVEMDDGGRKWVDVPPPFIAFETRRRWLGNSKK